MAGIWKRGSYWRAEIRRSGYPIQNRTFDTKADAEAWARRIESEMDRGAFADRKEATRNTLGDLLLRYSNEVSPHKKGGALEVLRIRKLCSDPIAALKVSALSGQSIAQYRDRRLAGDSKTKPVSGSTVNRELTLLGHVLTVARKEWAVHLDANPVSMIRRPKENRARSRRLYHGEEERLLQELELSQRTAEGFYEAGAVAMNTCARSLSSPSKLRCAAASSFPSNGRTFISPTGLYGCMTPRTGRRGMFPSQHELSPHSQSYQPGPDTSAVAFFRFHPKL